MKPVQNSDFIFCTFHAPNASTYKALAGHDERANRTPRSVTCMFSLSFSTFFEWPHMFDYE